MQGKGVVQGGSGYVIGVLQHQSNVSMEQHQWELDAVAAGRTGLFCGYLVLIEQGSAGLEPPAPAASDVGDTGSGLAGSKPLWPYSASCVANAKPCWGHGVS